MSMLNKLQALLLGLGLTSVACASAADVQVSVPQEIAIRIGEPCVGTSVQTQRFQSVTDIRS
jgi:hypothetical protein